jgi:flagellar export protein FliJ
MAKFRLATLERLRTTALEERGQELHAAALALAEGRAAHAAIAEALATATAPVQALPGALVRASHYRERLRVELADAVLEVQRLERDVERARQAWLHARAQLKAVGVLHDRHRQQVRADMARREQAELDDLASIKHATAAAHGGRG